MAFVFHSTDEGRVPGVEYLPASAITPAVGMALYMTGGRLALASGTTAPTYVSMTEKEEAVAAGDLIGVVRVLKNMIWETEWSASAASINVGDKVTIHTDGKSVTATTTNGVAEVISMDGTAVGDKVRVRF